MRNTFHNFVIYNIRTISYMRSYFKQICTPSFRRRNERTEKKEKVNKTSLHTKNIKQSQTVTTFKEHEQTSYGL